MLKENEEFKIKKIEDQFIDRFAENINTYGISPTVGRVLGLIYMNRKPMTLNELSEASGMSKTRMSQVVRKMVDLNIAEKVFEKGLRKDLYNVEQDYYQTFIAVFSTNWGKLAHKNKMTGKKLQKELSELLSSEDELTEEAEEKINELLEETRLLLNYIDWLDRLVDFFESEEIFKHVPKT
ncbi:GbsR/MarR family transcriptional regulator [Bacillus gobiensis]|uniref:GbsR/MarR family transcriptional regulator n=1 Tax=Bacillus gobiensis TaxID=1441095 RepID=UPI003D1A7C08